MPQLGIGEDLLLRDSWQLVFHAMQRRGGRGPGQVYVGEMAGSCSKGDGDLWKGKIVEAGGSQVSMPQSVVAYLRKIP